MQLKRKLKYIITLFLFAIAVAFSYIEYSRFYEPEAFPENSRQSGETRDKTPESKPDDPAGFKNPDNAPEGNSDSSQEKKIPIPPAPDPLEIKSVLLDVPFVSQAPLGNWSDPRKQDGCEEAAAIMAMAWVNGEKSLDAKSVDEEINDISKYEEDALGTFHDTSVFDTTQTIFKGYFKYNKVSVIYRIKKEDIIKELVAGNLVIVPARGQILGNPNYTPPGPVTHNLVITGYDEKTKEFITNDPGTRKGKGFRYNEDVLMDAVFDYPTGLHEKTAEEKTAMIIISK